MVIAQILKCKNLAKTFWSKKKPLVCLHSPPFPFPAMRVASYLLHYVGFQSCDRTVIKGETLAIFSHCLDYRNIWIWATNNNSALLPKEVFTFSRLDPHKACLLELCLVSVVYMDYTLLLLICALFFLFSFSFTVDIGWPPTVVVVVAAILVHTNPIIGKAELNIAKTSVEIKHWSLGRVEPKIWKFLRKKKKVAATYPACQLAVAVQSLQMPLKKRSTTNVTGAEILGEPIRFKPFSKFCKKKWNREKKPTTPGTWHFTCSACRACEIILI